MKRLVLFEGVYETLDLMMEHMKTALEHLGYETLVFSVRTLSQSFGALAEFCKQPVTAVITLNNVGYNLNLQEGKNIWDILGIPLINILVDHPLHYHEALLKMPQITAVLCIDRNHTEYVRRFYPNIPVTDFLPHGATPLFEVPVPAWEDRGIDVLYAGALAKNLTLSQASDTAACPETDCKALEKEVSQRLIDEPDTTLEAAVEQSLSDRNLQLPDDRLRTLIHDFAPLEYRATMFYRQKVLQTLVEAGIDVTVYGDGWSRCSFIHRPNCHYHPGIPVREVLKKMHDAKIVLNTMTWFKDGSHERVMNGMSAGALVVSDTSGYLKESFEDGKELILFSLTDIAGLPAVISDLLSHPERASLIARTGRLRAVSKEQWANRAEDIHRCLLS